MTLAELNALSPSDARQCFMNCCTATGWVDGMVAARPFSDEAACYKTAETVWESLGEADWLEAFEGHPQIGNVNTLREKYRQTKALAAGEQSSVEQASEETLQALADGNAEYLNRYGFIFIVCATGKSAQEMLHLLQARLGNEREVELRIAAQEQSAITALRLQKLLSAAQDEQEARS